MAGRPAAGPKGWLVTVAWRKFLDAVRADTSRRHREGRVESEPPPGPGEEVDDTSSCTSCARTRP